MSKKQDLPDLSEYLKACETSAQTLEVSHDEFNSAVDNINARLADIRPGISAWYFYAQTATKRRYLGYAKVNKHWGLAVKIASIKKNDKYEEEIWRLCEAPSWLRLEAVAALPEFLAVFADRIDEAAKKIEAATEKLNCWLEQMK